MVDTMRPTPPRTNLVHLQDGLRPSWISGGRPGQDSNHASNVLTRSHPVRDSGGLGDRGHAELRLHLKEIEVPTDTPDGMEYNSRCRDGRRSTRPKGARKRDRCPLTFLPVVRD